MTIVFSDVSGSTALGERLDPESMRQVMSRYFSEVKTVLERHGGTVEKFIGDAVMTVFGIPQLHEDDALRAVRAAAEVREALSRLNKDLEQEWGIQLQIRTGINTGEVVAGDPAAGQTLVTGDAVNVAARLEQAAPAGEILMGESTLRLVRDAVVTEPAGELDLKGKAEPVRAFRLLEVKAGMPGFSRQMDSPLVARDREQLLLQQAFERSVEDVSCHLFTLLGLAGVGKSRLVEEFLQSVGDQAAILRGRCLPYGEGITFWPVHEVATEAADLKDTDSQEEARAKIVALLQGEEIAEQVAERVAGAIGIGEAVTEAPEETFWAIRKLLEALARRNPLLVVFDDIHWAEPAFLDLIEHIADWSRDAAILVICVARPDLLDVRSSWGGGKLNATTILLEPLSEAETALLIQNLLGKAALAEEARTRIAEAAEGNPLFVEEMLRMLVDEGLLVRQNGHWAPAGDLSQVPIPGTIQALLSSRIDRLEEPERQVMECASVGGKVFYRGAVAELSAEELRSQLDRHLMTLVRKEMIRNDRSTFAGEDAFRFRHILIRDAAYEAMPKEARARMHQRFADWLERIAGERVGEYEEILGHHLAEAHRFRVELGMREGTGELAQRAAKRLGSAGRRALDRGDASAANRLLARACSLLSEEDPEKPQFLLLWTDALARCGELARSIEVAEQVESMDQAQPATKARARLGLLEHRLHITPEGAAETNRREVPSLIGQLEELGDEEGVAQGYGVLARSATMAAKWRDVAELASKALHHGGRGAGELASAMNWGPFPVDAAVQRLRALEQEIGADRLDAIFVSRNRAALEAMRGNTSEARELIERARTLARELGAEFYMATLGFSAGAVETLAGNLAGAEAALRDSHERLERIGEQDFRSTIDGVLANILYEEGRYAEAAEFAEASRQAASSDDASSQALWRGLLSKILARRGEFEQVERLSREAVQIIDETDSLNEQGAAYMSLGEVLWMAGKSAEAMQAMEQAIDRYDAKGNTVMAGRSRERLAQLQRDTATT